MPRVVVPVGLALGSGVDRAANGREDWSLYFVRIGDSYAELTAAEKLAWVIGRVDLEGQERLAIDRTALVEVLRELHRPVSDAAELVDGLIARGLLLEFDPDGPLEPVLSRYRLSALADGMGATNAEPGVFWIGRSGTHLIGLPLDLYLLWALADGAASVWDACRRAVTPDAAGSPPDAAGSPPDAVDDLARQFVRWIPLLVASGCAALDLAQPR